MTAATKQPAKKATVSMSGDRSIHIERVFNATRDRVWEAMTKPELVAPWWGRGNKLEVERLEVRRGGHWRFVEHAHGEAHGSRDDTPRSCRRRSSSTRSNGMGCRRTPSSKP